MALLLDEAKYGHDEDSRTKLLHSYRARHKDDTNLNDIEYYWLFIFDFVWLAKREKNNSPKPFGPYMVFLLMVGLPAIEFSPRYY